MAQKNDGAAALEENTEKKSSNGFNKGSRPPFTAVDVIIAVLAFVLLVYLLINLPG